MLLNHQTFYRKFGVRLIPQVAMPAMHDLKFLQFPREAIYHYLPFDGLTYGPANDDPLIRDVKRNPPVLTVVHLTSFEGHPVRMAGDPNALVREYLRTHRRFRKVADIGQALNDPNTPVVINYALINRLYRYQANILQSYWKWKNLFVTFLDEFNRLAQQTNHQHYVFVHAPKTLPSVRQLMNAAKEFGKTNVQYFREPSSYLLLEFWKWFDADASSTSLLASIPKNKIHLLNFVFVEADKWCVINFGILNSFFVPKAGDEPDPEYVIQSRQRVAGIQMGKRVLRMYMTIMETRNTALKLMLEQEKQPEVKTPAPTSAPNAEAGAAPDQPITESDLTSREEQTQQEEASQEPTAKEKLTTDFVTQLPNISIIDEEEFQQLPSADFNRVISEQDAEIDQDLQQLEEISEKALQEASHESVEEIVKPQEGFVPEKGVLDLCEKLATTGSISAAEYRRYGKSAVSYKEIKAPFGEGTLEEFIRIPPEKLKISDRETMPDSHSVVDKTMLKSSVGLFDEKYVKEVLHRDIANTVMSVQNSGVAVTNYKVEKVDDILGGYEEHAVKLSPVVGQPSTLRFKVPVIREDGTYITNGVKYRLRKQRGDLPIRKTAPNVVALTSYYGKCFVTRGRRNGDNYGYWLGNQALAKSLDKEDMTMSDPVCDNVFDKTLAAPRSYTALSNVLAAVTVNNRFRVRFDHAAAVKEDEAPGGPAADDVYLGKDTQDGTFLYLGKDGVIKHVGKEGSIALMGTLEQFLDIAVNGAPVEYCTARVFGKDIPIGVMLGLEMGAQALLGALRVQPRVIPAGERGAVIGPHEWALRFSDETWVFERGDKLVELILGGFLEYEKSLKLFSAHSFDKRGVYVNLLDTNGVGVRYVRELDLMNQMFVDSITRDILVEMKEPTTLRGLLFRAAQMLQTDQHPDELDPAFMRIKGYERISGAIYTELVHAIRQHNSALGKPSIGVQMNPYSVWKRISEDTAKLQVSEINPLATLKDAEAVTYLGEGGRGRLSMTKSTRGYHPNDMGTISEATVDNSDVSINIHMSADPQFTSLRGMSRRFDLDNPNPTALLSTSALLAPASDRDDPKRVNFVSIQQKHAIACFGYHQPIVRTGYESVLAHRTDDLYAYTAKKPGKVHRITGRGIIIDYDDGESVGYELGRRFGNAQGLTVAHEIRTLLNDGDKVEVGDCICYNDGFFEPDFFDSKRVVWKNSLNVRTVLWESSQTHEDSSSISKRVSALLTTRITKVKMVVLDFNQSISRLVKAGDDVLSDTVLCLIEDEVTANNKLFNEQSIETLKILSAQAPRAHVQGQVERVEVFYHGDKEDMSASVRELCDWGDEQLRRLAKDVNRKVNTGQVDGGFRIENNPLGLDQVAVKIYITSNVGAGVGDKGVFGNQLKTCFGEVMEQPMTSEDGQEIDAIFGYRSLQARIVESPIIIGTTASLLKLIGQQAVAIYEGTAGK